MKGYIEIALLACIFFAMLSCSDDHLNDDPVIYVEAPKDTTMLYISQLAGADELDVYKRQPVDLMLNF